MRLSKLLGIGALVTMLAACGSFRPVTVGGLTETIGDSVPGAQGKTLEDQNKIDEHVARACAAELYTEEKCALHTERAAERRRQLPRRLRLDDTSPVGLTG